MEAAVTMSSITAMYQALQVIATYNITTYLCPEQPYVTDDAYYDFIIIGSSGAGSVIASRLTEDKNTKVLLVDAGGCPPFESALTSLLGFTFRKENLWGYEYQKPLWQIDNFYQDRAKVVKMAKMLGGSSSINDYTYLRGDPHDYDLWAKAINDDSWSFKNILPLFIKSEKLKDSEIAQSSSKDYHGYDGYLGVTKQDQQPWPNAEKYLKSFEENNPIVTDFNERDRKGYCKPLMTLNYIRQSGAFSFLTPIKNRKNLDVLTYHTAVQIIFDESKKATGVKLMDKNGKTITVHANKEIIVTAGPVNTAKLLMLSGIGPKKYLKSKNIEVLSDLPVGQNNVINQPYVPIFHVTGKSSPTKVIDSHKFPVLFGIYRNSLDELQTFADYQTKNYYVNRDSMMLYCLAYFFFKESFCQYMYNEAKDREVMFSLISPLRPKSRGSVQLKSSNPLDAPIITDGLLSDEADMYDIIDYIKHFNKNFNSTYFKSVNSKLLKEPNCSKKGDDYWKCYVKGARASEGDLAGACPIGEVVDKDMFVRGVKGLRIADESVAPTPVGGTIYITSLMIGERASEKIKDLHQIS